MNKEDVASFTAEEVVAPGKRPQYMQFPSPVYFARWINENYAIIGAGGGGRRFGMVNLLAIITVNSTPQQEGEISSVNNNNNTNNNRQASGEQKNSQQQELSTRPWRFITAVDLEGNIPWCASAFLPCTDETEINNGVVGHIAVSHITCFTLVEVRRNNETKEFKMRRIACIKVPSDAKNPDKKPIALIKGAIIIAHDEGGVHIYALHPILLQTREVTRENVKNYDASYLKNDNDEILSKLEASTSSMTSEESKLQEKEEQNKGFTSLPIIENQEPIAVWSLPARVNDLHANRFFVPKRVSSESKNHHYKYSEYLLIAVLVQDKTLRLGTMKLNLGNKNFTSKHYDKSKKLYNSNLIEAGLFTGKDCHIPFSLMKSSMRLVQLFGVEDVAPKEVNSIWKKARHLHCKKGIRGAMPIAGFVLVVYDVMGNQSYILTGQVLSTSEVKNENSLLRDHQHSTPSTIATTASSIPNQTVGSVSKVMDININKNIKGKRSKHLALRVCFNSQPSPIVKEGITSISSCHYCKNNSENYIKIGEGVGTIIPSYWLAGTVEGTILSFEYCGNGEFKPLLTRPSKNKTEAKLYPSFHQEPISCVSVSLLNDVLTTDIAQNVVVSVLPFWEASSSKYPLLNSEKKSLGTFDKIEENKSRLSKSKMHYTEFADNSMSMRPKYMEFSLFPQKQTSKILVFFGYNTTMTNQLLFTIIILPLIAVLIGYWLM